MLHFIPTEFLKDCYSMLGVGVDPHAVLTGIPLRFIGTVVVWCLNHGMHNSFHDNGNKGH